jgi:hypothetical protein
MDYTPKRSSLLWSELQNGHTVGYLSDFTQPLCFQTGQNPGLGPISGNWRQTSGRTS